MKAKHSKQGGTMAGTSKAQNTAVGSGSRPGTKGRYPIETSAPSDAHSQGRAPKGTKSGVLK